MGNPLCAVEDCTRRGITDMVFPTEHASETSENAHSLICEYHTAMAVEYFASIGIQLPINVTPKKVIFGAMPSLPDWRRWRKRKPVDNTE